MLYSSNRLPVIRILKREDNIPHFAPRAAQRILTEALARQAQII
jgi:hypothetical protein